MNKIIKYLKHPLLFIIFVQNRLNFKIISDKAYLRILFKNRLDYKLNLKNPQTFNEKIQWLKIYDRKKVYTEYVDKMRAKELVKEIIGGEYIIPTLKVWDSPNDIDISDLPNSFVIKTTHDSGGICICENKNTFNLESCKKKMKKSIKNNYYLRGREWVYKNVERKIIAEQFIESEFGTLNDYKFMCFNGRVEYIFVCTDRFTSKGLHITFFDRKWNKMPFERFYPSSNEEIEKPKALEEMISLAEKLSDGIPFVRVDFYYNKGNVYFGEMTFYPGNGMEPFNPQEWDYKLGEKIVIKK